MIPSLLMEAKKQNFKRKRDRFVSLLFIPALMTGVASCGGGTKELTLVQVECKVIGWGDIIPGGPDEGPYRKVLTKYWSDGTTTTERSDQTTYKPSCP